jgi:hypothetical protein
MVVNTRSRSSRIEAAADIASTAAAESRDRRRVRIQTSSFRDASIRTYKIYTGGISRRRDEAAAAAAAEALIEMSKPDYDDVIESDATATATATATAAAATATARINHMCINPMRPITQYMYQIVVYNYDRTLHHKSAFILYNKATRMYYIYSIISNGHAYHGGSCEFDASTTTTTTTVEPVNTIQTKFASYTTETITEYVMTLLVPSFGHNYYIQDQIIGVVSTVSNDDTTYYEIEQILYEKSSSETTNGLNAFPLIPYREYWADSVYQYTEDTIHSALQILGQSV